MSSLVDGLVEFIFAVMSIGLLVWSFATNSTRFACPERYHNMGIRPSGGFCCWHEPGGNPEYDGTFGKPDRSWRPPGKLCSMVHCTGGSSPIVVNYRVVGCRR